MRVTSQRFLAVSAILVVLLTAFLPGALAQKKSKPLSKEDILELLTGDVPPGRVADIVRERRVSFALMPTVEEEIRRDGGDDELIKAIRDFGPEAPAVEHTAGPPMLMIEVSPGTAQVYVDDEPVGTTSAEGRLKLSHLAAGEHRLRIGHAGYRDCEKAVQLASGQTTLFAVNLETATPTPAPAAPASSGPGYLGLELNQQQTSGGNGVVLAGVNPGGPAAKAGLKASDTVLSVAGSAVKTPQELMAAVASHRAGETVEVVWTSDSQVMTKAIQLVSRPAAEATRQEGLTRPGFRSGGEAAPAVTSQAVWHLHAAGGCAGTLSVVNGMIQYESKKGGHSFSFPVGEVKEAKRNGFFMSTAKAFHIRFRKGASYNFCVINDKGVFQDPDAILAAINRAAGQQ